jgi:hypothetical protein
LSIYDRYPTKTVERVHVPQLCEDFFDVQSALEAIETYTDDWVERDLAVPTPLEEFDF